MYLLYRLANFKVHMSQGSAKPPDRNTDTPNPRFAPHIYSRIQVCARLYFNSKVRILAGIKKKTRDFDIENGANARGNYFSSVTFFWKTCIFLIFNGQVCVLLVLIFERCV